MCTTCSCGSDEMTIDGTAAHGAHEHGEQASVVLVSVTEGDDKPLNYPHMFHVGDLLLMNKTDLLPHVRFDMARCVAAAREVNPRIEILRLSAETGEGMQDWYRWLAAQHASAGAAAA